MMGRSGVSRSRLGMAIFCGEAGCFGGLFFFLPQLPAGDVEEKKYQRTKRITFSLSFEL